MGVAKVVDKVKTGAKLGLTGFNLPFKDMNSLVDLQKETDLSHLYVDHLVNRVKEIFARGVARKASPH